MTTATEFYRKGSDLIAWGEKDDGSKWRVAARPLLFGRVLLAVNEGASLDEIESLDDYEPRFYDRGYEYEDFIDAYHAIVAFDGGEPLDGWTRAFPPRFRRRLHGDPAREEVRP